MSKFGIVPITIPRQLFNTRNIKRVLSNVGREAARSIKVDYRVTTQTWNNKPSFSITKIPGHSFDRVIGTDSDIYKFVDKGTRIRYAVMTPDFQAKSRVKVIGSRKGRGGFSHMNFKKPKPGIEAREFSEEIADKWTKLLPRLIDRAIQSEIAHNA